MANRYNHARVQEYWQHVWDREGVYELDDAAVERGEGTYVLGMFPYTSGSLHMGHIRNYAITDAVARFRRMQGGDVLHPMGWDAFGLPAENAAYDRDTDPESWTRTCIEQMRDELERMGFGYDWSREITTCDPDYYRWNQYLFTRFYEEGLVEYTGAQVNWCPDCETVLADAQVERPGETDDAGQRNDAPGHASGEGVCWRCGTAVETRELDQWFFTITDYADELVDGLDDLAGWPDSVREIQRNWIGRQAGAEITFDVDGHSVDVFTTRPDTVFGATYLAVAPGHEVAQRATSERANGEAVSHEIAREAADDGAVADYLDRAADGTVEGMAGVDTGLTATNPVTGEEIPVYVASYVLDDVGTGAVMGVPAHNERDHAFADEHDIAVEQVVAPLDSDGETGLPFTDDGMVTVDGEYEGLASEAARERLLDHDAVAEATTYRLRDWLISRQRYWGTPIPVVHCDDCGHVPVPDEDLPVELPEYVKTTGNPLAASEAFVETECPECGAPAERETDTMDTFVDSSWYFLRYLAPDLADAPFDSDVADDWLPVDVYVGGDEHAVLHLLYIRFFTRALADLGLLDRREPVERLVNQGTVLHSGEKMSKSKGNDVAPHEYGAETTRLFVLSAAHPGQDFEWTATDVSNAYEFQQDVYGMVDDFTTEADSRTESQPHDAYLEREIDRTIAAVTDEYERFRFHRVITEIQQFAQLLRRYRDYETPYRFAYSRGLRVLAKLLAPLAPYLAEELWSMLDGEGLIAAADWPAPLQELPDYRTERELVRTTLDDVREITEVVDITDPEEIELIVAPAWSYRVYERAREVASEADPREASEQASGETASTDGPVIGTVMQDDEVPGTDAAADYAADLADRAGGFEPVLSPERELTVLEQATWLFREEFGADVTVRQADPDGEYADSARPNKPAIHIS